MFTFLEINFYKKTQSVLLKIHTEKQAFEFFKFYSILSKLY